MKILRVFLIVIFCTQMLHSEADNLRYRVLDIDKVIDNSVAYIEFKSRLDKANAKYQKEIEFYESQLIKLDKQIKNAQTKKDALVKIKQTIVLYESKVQEAADPIDEAVLLAMVERVANVQKCAFRIAVGELRLEPRQVRLRGHCVGATSQHASHAAAKPEKLSVRNDLVAVEVHQSRPIEIPCTVPRASCAGASKTASDSAPRPCS